MDSVGQDHLPHRLVRWPGARWALWALYGLQAGSGVRPWWRPAPASMAGR